MVWMFIDAMRLEPSFKRVEVAEVELEAALRSGVRISSIAALMAREPS